MTDGSGTELRSSASAVRNVTAGMTELGLVSDEGTRTLEQLTGALQVFSAGAQIIQAYRAAKEAYCGLLTAEAASLSAAESATLVGAPYVAAAAAVTVTAMAATCAVLQQYDISADLESSAGRNDLISQIGGIIDGI